MSRLLQPLLLIVLLSSCDRDDDNPRKWDASFVLAGATHPVISSSDMPDRFLYYVEGQGGGLFLHRENGGGARLTPEGVSARSDAVWSANGEFFTFSIPGEPGVGESGIYVGGISSPLLHVWDRGSEPSLSPDASELVCSGPQEDPDHAGLWLVDLGTIQAERIRETGTKPKFGPDGQIAYLTPLASSNGAALYVGDDLRGMYVTDYAWLPSTGELLYETASNQISEVLPQTIYRIGPNDALPGEVIQRDATNICAIGGDVLLNQANGDVLGSLVLRAGQKTLTISDSLWRASATSPSVILASGPSGISKLIER
ncbi:hypothetical protein IT157_06030 [bacterium]|nr:hypothetical protein [bacterium]